MRTTKGYLSCLSYRFLESVSTEKQPLFDKILIANRSAILSMASHCILMLYAGVKSRVESLRRRRSWASRRWQYTAKWTRTRSMCKWYDSPFIQNLSTECVQADEAYCVGPAPSSESYVSGHALSTGEFSTNFSFVWILSLMSRRGVVHRSVISPSEGFA